MPCNRQRELYKQLVGFGRSWCGVTAAELEGLDAQDLSQRIKDELESSGPVLLVLDDLGSVHQLTQLLGADTALPEGSQLLLTSRRRDAVAEFDVVPMELLPDGFALAVLAWHACGHTSLPAHLTKVAADALRACCGVPLALGVLGGAFRREAATLAAWKVKPL